MGCHFLLQCMKVKVKSLSCVQLFATPWTAAYQAPPSMGVSRQKYCSRVPLLSSCYMCAKSLQLCPTLHNPVDCRLPSSSLHGVLHARILEWVAIPFFRGSSQPKGLNFSSVQRKWQPTPVFLPGESQGWRSLVGCRLWGHTESDTTEAT